VLEQQGGDRFFGEPALDVITDLMRTSRDGRGIINILAADKLMSSPRLYATFLLWLLSELFEKLPEVGDPDKPKLVFFFDEAHLLFDEAPKALLEEGRAGGAADPLQGRRRLFRDAEPARRAGDGAGPARQPHPARAARLHPARAARGEGGGRHLPPNPDFDSFEAITELGVGEALVSTLEADGVALDGPAHADPSAILAHRRLVDLGFPGPQRSRRTGTARHAACPVGRPGEPQVRCPIAADSAEPD
jgi:uncharacterized protein